MDGIETCCRLSEANRIRSQHNTGFEKCKQLLRGDGETFTKLTSLWLKLRGIWDAEMYVDLSSGSDMVQRLR